MKNIELNGTNVIPNKIVCIGRNYVEHIEELENEVPSQMVIFYKPNSSIGEEIVVEDESLHYEGELSFLVSANKLVAVAFGLDLTKREVQSHLKAKGLPWERAKGFRNSALFSEFVSFTNIENLSLELYINDMLVQFGGVNMMINRPQNIVHEVLKFIDLDDNDILMSGTPKGVGKIKIGDKLSGVVLENGKTLVRCEWIVS